VFGFGPLFQARDQRRLIHLYDAEIGRAANEASGLAGVSTAEKAPATGSPVGILEIGRVRLQQVVLEGVGSSQTYSGPGHVPGTAAPGQPGNSVVVARARGFGGPFRSIGRLRKGDRILVATTQGQSVYEVSTVRRTRLEATGRAEEPAGGEEEAGGTATGRGRRLSIEEDYGPTAGNQLTLVTSASRVPWNRSRATVVVASMVGTPFAPSPQNGRSDAQSGMTGDDGAAAAVVLAMIVYGATLGASILLYQRFRATTAYVLTIAPVMASTIIAGETLSRVFPAWM